jgi:hypothetical protein
MKADIRSVPLKPKASKFGLQWAELMQAEGDQSAASDLQLVDLANTAGAPSIFAARFSAILQCGAATTSV